MADEPLTPPEKPEEPEALSAENKPPEPSEPPPSEADQETPSAPEAPSAEAAANEALDEEQVQQLFLSALNDEIESEIGESPDDEEEEDDFENVPAGPTEEIRSDEDRPRRRYERQGRRRRGTERPTEGRERIAGPEGRPEARRPVISNPWLVGAVVAVAVAAAAAIVYFWTR